MSRLIGRYMVGYKSRKKHRKAFERYSYLNKIKLENKAWDNFSN